MRKAIAIDFDGCLCENAWPEIGAPHWGVIRAAQLAQHEGVALILWTCRCGEQLEAAVAWCRDFGLVFDAINENPPDRLEYYRVESRKIIADEYWDDRAVHMPLPPNNPLTLDELREMDGEPVWVRDHCTGDYTCRVISSSGEHFTHFTDGGLSENRSYGSYWTAYRRKPEEGMA